MMNWNYNIDEAPRGTKITETTMRKGKEVEHERFIPQRIWICIDNDEKWSGVSYWIPKSENGLDGGRWANIGKDQKPLAWSHVLEHPNK